MGWAADPQVWSKVLFPWSQKRNLSPKKGGFVKKLHL